jgi:hypothetical protein
MCGLPKGKPSGKVLREQVCRSFEKLSAYGDSADDNVDNDKIYRNQNYG